MSEESGEVHHYEQDNLLHLGLNYAEEDGRLSLVGSTYMPSDDRIVDSIRPEGGSRLVTFAPVLKRNNFPLAQILDHVLKTCEEFLVSPVEMEFAINVDREKGNKNSQYCKLGSFWMNQWISISIWSQLIRKGRFVLAVSRWVMES